MTIQAIVIIRKNECCLMQGHLLKMKIMVNVILFHKFKVISWTYNNNNNDNNNN